MKHNTVHYVSVLSHCKKNIFTGAYVTHHNKKYLMSARLILRYGAKELIKYKENN